MYSDEETQVPALNFTLEVTFYDSQFLTSLASDFVEIADIQNRQNGVHKATTIEEKSKIY